MLMDLVCEGGNTLTFVTNEIFIDCTAALCHSVVEKSEDQLLGYGSERYRHSNIQVCSGYLEQLLPFIEFYFYKLALSLRITCIYYEKS